jgi:hypothetical protein
MSIGKSNVSMDSKKQRGCVKFCCENWIAKFALYWILWTNIQLEKHEDSNVDLSILSLMIKY